MANILSPLFQWSAKFLFGEPPAPSADSKDQRRYARTPVDYAATISWKSDDGNTVGLHVRVLDLSRLGAQLQTPRALDPGTTLFLQIPNLNMMGTAVVRHCAGEKKKFRIGLQFPGELMRAF